MCVLMICLLLACSLATGRLVGNHDLMHQRLVIGRGEHRVGDLKFRHRSRYLHQLHFHEPFLYFVFVVLAVFRALTLGRITTSWPLGPGMAPLTMSRLRSASTCMTSRFRQVAVACPRLPAMGLPGNTRPGVWRWPIEPGARCESELPWLARPPRKWWRLITPAKPLPIEVPCTSTCWPTLNISALISAPGLRSAPSPASRRNSHSPRPGATPFFA